MGNAEIGSRPVTSLRGVGPSLAGRLAKLGIHTVQDLLFLLPLRYEDRTRIVPIGALRRGDRASLEGTIQLSEVAFRRRRTLLCNLSDGTGSITLRFFYFSKSQQDSLQRGALLRCYGEVRQGPAGLELVHPEYRLIKGDQQPPTEDNLTPIYPTTEGVQQGRVRQLTSQALAELDRQKLREYLPQDLLDDLELPALKDALCYVHRPPADARLDTLESGRHETQRRLALEELLAHHLSLKQLRERLRKDPATPLQRRDGLTQRFLADLSFSLTGAQQRVVDEIHADLERNKPMLRLVQGDVGSGKTVVAACAALRAVENSCQVAIMAPTELLAEQHYRNFSEWLEPLGVSVTWLASKLKARIKREALADIESGSASVVVGTHALFQAGVEFSALALVVVDEQHRFGVHQRLALREKGIQAGVHPHQLIMTATPIPRTLAMTAYADLDTSVIDELPPGRRPVTTVAIPQTRREEVVERVRDACRRKHQAYWVCPLIDESEALDYEAAEETASALEAALPELNIGLIHGRMKPAQKEQVMTRFKEGRIEVLVATTVIEVGVDVPNASLMIVENAERMGLAQLHQLRGRVGRGHEQSSCLLLYKPPLSGHARTRLAVLRETNDGFEVARKDLELRGPGEVLGTRQTGLMQMKVADLMRDADLLPKIHRAAELLRRRYPENIVPLIRRWIGEADQYGTV